MNKSTKCKNRKKHLGESFKDFPEGTVDDGIYFWCSEKCYKNKKCSHNLGWCSIRRNTIFVTKKDDVHIGFDRNKYGFKIEAECNKGCKAKRNMYFDITGKFVLFGKIKECVNAVTGEKK